jgi:hypothetical protein
MDVNSVKGREAIKRVKEAISKIDYLGSHTVWFPDHSFIEYDGYFVKDGTVIGLFEAKTRNAAVQDGKILYGGKLYDEYMITLNKIVSGVSIAKGHRINAYIVVNFEINNVVAVFKTFDYATGEAMPYRWANTWTQRSINGGQANRENAFIDMSYAHLIKI